MKDIKSIIRLNCIEEIDIKYFAKDESIVDTTIDYGELLEYINDIEDRITKAIEYIKYWTQDGGIILSWESVIKILEGEEVE